MLEHHECMQQNLAKKVLCHRPLKALSHNYSMPFIPNQNHHVALIVIGPGPTLYTQRTIKATPSEHVSQDEQEHASPCLAPNA